MELTVIFFHQQLYKSSKNKLNKNGKQGVYMIASNLKNKIHKSVYVLNADDLAVKEYIRMFDYTKVMHKKLKQRINTFTLRLEMKYS